MLQFRRTFESEKHQLQELNNRLSQYLSRTKQLEQENACLITEINKLRQTKTAEWEQQYKAEMRDLRRMVGQLSFEKSQAEMEREKQWRELQMVQSLCSQETEVCRDIGGELKGCEKELHHAHKTNSALEQRLFQLENEYKCLEDAHNQEIAHLRRQVDSRVVPIITQTYHGPQTASLEEVQEYARGLSEGWIETFEMYQQKVEEMEQSIKADQARLEDLRREKMLYAAEFDKLRAEAEKQGQIQIHLEEQLMHMQDTFRGDFTEFQMIIEQLERERNILADSIADKLREHQQLLQVKMDLGMEVAAYRALLEGERVDLQDAHRRANQHQRERIIDIKMPSQPYTPRAATSTRQHVDVRYMEQTSNLRRSPVPRSGSISPSRVIPISVTGWAQHQSPASRRDMISFTKARAAASASATTTKDKQVAQNESQRSRDAEKVQKKAAEEKSVKIKQASQPENQFSPIISPTVHSKSVRVVSPPMMSLGNNTEMDSKRKVSDEKEEKGNAYQSDFKGKGNIEAKTGPSEKKILESVSVEEIIEKVIKPAGLDAKVSSSGESKVTYHVEKTEQEDGTTKTQIVLESKVEEELDFSEDTALDDLLSRGVKKVTLEDIKDTATGSMIQNLLSGLQGGENLANKSVNVEIIEEPVESHSDEEYEVEQTMSSFQPSSTYFQIEELENVPHDSEVQESDDDTLKTLMTDKGYGKGGSVQVQEVSRESESPYFSHGQEPHEYFVSTPDDNLSEHEEGGGITSYGHYGVVDDLSDERYYQDEGLPTNRMAAEESDEYKFISSDHSFVKESFPECIIEEEIHVSPTVQESVLEFLREDSLDPKEQLKGALEKIQGSVSGPLKDELAFLTNVSSDSPQNLAVDVKKVQQSTDNGTMTIVAELNVSQTLEDSGLLEAEGDDLSEEQIMAALQSSNPGLEKALQGGAGGGYSMRVSTDQDVTHVEGLEGFTTEGESVTDITEWHTELGPSEKSFTFQMDVNNSQAQASSEPVLQSQFLDTQLKVSHEKRVATVYLESTSDD
ncbi:synemin [Centroberyx gerrardi]|uniref:synemin n=1 Tax=Centroberyx gerrardi TaxID=166262 RepID=UPI003AAC92C5